MTDHEVIDKVGIITQSGVVWITAEEFAAPKPREDRRTAMAMAVHRLVLWRAGCLFRRMCEAGKRTSDASRPRGTGKSYWAWMDRREALIRDHPEYQRLSVEADRLRLIESPLVSPFLFSTHKHLLADRWAEIRRMADARFEYLKTRSRSADPV